MHDDTITEPVYDVTIKRDIHGICRYRWEVRDPTKGDNYVVADGMADTKWGARWCVRQLVKALDEPIVEQYRLRKERRS